MGVTFLAQNSAYLLFCPLSLALFSVSPCKMERAESIAIEAVEVEVAPKAGDGKPQHRSGVAGLVIRSLKRCKALQGLSIKYRCLGEKMLAETLPDPAAYKSKRKWETAMMKARETLRLMAPDVDPDANVDSSSAGSDARPSASEVCELELAGSDGALDFDGVPDFQWV